jgi:peptide-methionine (S)-S-oxide reductase
MPKKVSLTETATFGSGCFWCTEAVFQRLKGVEKVVSGYAGGTMEKPSYDDVCSGKTGHAEVVQITFDPRVITYRDLLEIFFATHDPTTKNRQGNDTGTQYRSVILYADDFQKKAAEDIVKELNDNKTFAKPIVTGVEPLKNFFSAENYHQNYYNTNTGQPYCQFVIAPKLAKFKQKFASLLKPEE